jgi:hypothetical protein
MFDFGAFAIKTGRSNWFIEMRLGRREEVLEDRRQSSGEYTRQ